MQMFIGNTFGIKMQGLEENKQKLHRMQNPIDYQKESTTTVETEVIEKGT